MKITVSLTVELDPEDWMTEYGVARNEVRDDVRQYVLTGVQSMLAERFGEGDATATLRSAR